MRGNTPQSGQEKSLKKTKKGLDKWHKVCYNISVKRRETKTSTNRGVGKVIQ
jgi:hypothetical protein